MDNEQLVKLITKEVMSRLKTILNENKAVDQRKVLVLEKEEVLCPTLISALKEKKYAVHCLNNMESLNSYEGIILQNLTNGELANLSNGIEGSLKEKAVIDALLRGNKIYSLENGTEYKKFAATSNKPFFNMFKGYEDTLKSYGINFVELNELLDCLGNKCDKIDKPLCSEEFKEIYVATEGNSGNHVDLTKKKLISEVELRNILKKGIKKVIVSKKTIVTPLAMDYARINKFQISRK